MATTLKAYYNGSAFVPVIPVEASKGQIFTLSILREDTHSDDMTTKAAAFGSITENLKRINDAEPLPAEFDEILSQRIRFKPENV